MIVKVDVLYPRNDRIRIRSDENLLDNLNIFGDVTDFVMPLYHDFTDKLGPITRVP